MTSNDHLKLLLELRTALIQEVARLDVAITRENAQGREAREHLRLWRDGSLSWEEALHRAKIPAPGEQPALHA